MSMERIERVLESVEKSVSQMRAELAALTARMDAAASVHQEVADVREHLAKHEKEDAAVQSALHSDVHRLWWGCGIALAAVAGAWAKMVIG